MEQNGGWRRGGVISREEMDREQEGVFVCEGEKETGRGGIIWVRTVTLRHDWLCQEEISSLHIPLPSHLQGPGIKRWRTPPRAPLH